MKKIAFSFILTLMGVPSLFASEQIVDFAWKATDQAETTEIFTSEDGKIIVRNLGATTPSSRSKLGYTLAIKCSSVELDLSSLNQNIGDLRIAIQNGSSGNVMTQTTEYYNGTEWVFAQTTEYPGNGDILDFPENIVSKGNVERVRFTFDRASWFYGLTASTNDTADGNPEFLNVNPESGANLSYSGELNVRFDEIVKAGSNNITLGNATITSADYRGNMLVVNYDGLTSNPVLNIPSSSILDLNGNSIDSDINIVYKLDNTAPVFESVSPINGSEIHVNDLGETSRKINVKFNEDIVLGEGEITFGKASLTTVVEGNTLIIGYEGLDYNSQNTLLIPASAIKDLSDNYIENDLSFTFTTGSRDAQSPVLISTSINNGDVMPIAGSISITFDEIINIASQKASVNGENVYLSNNLSVVGVNYNSLNYGGEEYVLNIPAGCITDTCGNEFPAFEISFVTENKNPQAFSIIVDKNGEYKTIQSAIEAASGTERTLIYIKPGIYKEKVTVHKDNISLIGESADNTIISWDECSSTSTTPFPSIVPNSGTDASYTMIIAGDNFYGENFTVRNDYDYQNGTHSSKQAVALEHKDSDKAVLKNVKMFSFQDTYYPKTINTRQYLIDCMIQGGTDFIFGSGTTFIENTLINCVEGGQYITASSETYKEFGLILNNCDVQYADTTGFGNKRQFYLGRPWKAPAKTSFVNCRFEDGLIHNAGWAIWSGTENHLSAVYNEYNSVLFDGMPVDISQRADWSSQINHEDVSRYNFDNAFNFGTNDTWNPLEFSTEPDMITYSVNNGNIKWNETPSAVGYLIYKNGELFTNVTTPSFEDDSYNKDDQYNVVGYNKYGAVSKSEQSEDISSSIESTDINDIEGFLRTNAVEDFVIFTNPEDISRVEIYSLNGSIVFSANVNGESLNISSLSKGFYIIKGFAIDGNEFKERLIKR